MKNVHLIDLKTKNDVRGSLTVVENQKDIPFNIARVFWIYGVPEKSIRGGHGHRRNKQLHVCLSGSVTYVMDNGHTKEKFTLNTPNQGLYNAEMIWHSLEDFAPNTIIQVFNSVEYDDKEYIKDYEEFLKLAKENN